MGGLAVDISWDSLFHVFFGGKFFNFDHRQLFEDSHHIGTFCTELFQAWIVHLTGFVNFGLEHLFHQLDVSLDCVSCIVLFLNLFYFSDHTV